MANDLLLPAIYMVIAISIGMAMTLSIIGVLAILGRQFAERRFEGNESRSRAFANGARIFGAACVVLIGLFLISVTLSEVA